jgi:hypothetical protein
MSKRHKIILIAAAVLGVLLRVLPIWTRQTWYDENFTIILARLPLPDLIAATAGDVHPPLWYLICWIPAHLGLPGWAICRLPALLASLGSLYVFWLVVQYFYFPTNRMQVIAFVLFAMLPAQIYYAQEGRQYSLLSLLVLLAFLFVMKQKYLGLIIVTTAMLYLHNYGMFYAAAIGLMCLATNFPIYKKIKLTAALTLAGFLFLPWLMLLFLQMAEIQGSYWMINFTFGSVLSDIAHSFWSKSTSLPATLINFAVFWGTLGAAVIWILRRPLVFWYRPILIMTFVPPLLAILVSLIWQPVMLFRALVPISPFLVLLVMDPLDVLFENRRQTYLVAFFVLPALITNLVSTSLRFLWPDTDLEAQVIDYIAEHYQPGDVIYHNSDGFFVALEAWQSFPKDAVLARVPECDPVLGGLSPVTRQNIGETEGPLPDGIRTWTFALASPLGPQCELDTLEVYGLLDQPPVMCSRDDQLVSACLYLTTP